MDLFWLYRATAPSPRAQSIQVVHSAHALAARGHRVTVAVQAPGHPRPTPEGVLAAYGLAPVPGLRLHVLPSRRTPASIAFRALFARWLIVSGGRGIAVARSKRYADEALRVAGRRFRLVLEAHEVDSRQAEERGEDPTALRALEARVLDGAAAVVCNAPGTLALLRETHPRLPPALAVHNATHPSRRRRPEPAHQHGIGYTGSLRAAKGLSTLARAAALTRHPVHLVGGDDGRALQALAADRLVLEPGLPHHAVPDRLARFKVLALPLAPGLFGERLTSPLKLWDYLASGVPIVGADLPSLREAAPGAFLPYPPDDPAALAAALDRAADDESLRARLLAHARVRTWDERAAEVEAFLGAVLG